MNLSRLQRGGVIRADRRAAQRLLVLMTAIPSPVVNIVGAVTAGVLIAADLVTGPEVRVQLLDLLLVAAWSWAGPAGVALAAGLAHVVIEAIALPAPDAIGPWLIETVALVFGLVLVVALTTRLRNLVLALERQARTDPLTGALNARGFRAAAEIERRRAMRSAEPLTMVFLDLDGFKALNDRHGHVAGDETLARFGAGLRDAIRPYDVLGRLGGDEFAILLPDTDALDAGRVVSRMRLHLTHLLPEVGFSAGTATFLLPPRDIESMIRVADGLMYEAKRRGKGASWGRVMADDDDDGTTTLRVDVAFGEREKPPDRPGVLP